MKKGVGAAARTIADDKQVHGPVLMFGFKADRISGTDANRRWRIGYEMRCFQGALCDDDHGDDEKTVDVETTDAALARVGLAIDETGKLVLRSRAGGPSEADREQTDKEPDIWDEFRSEDLEPIGLEEFGRLPLAEMPDDDEIRIRVMDNYFPDTT